MGTGAGALQLRGPGPCPADDDQHNRKLSNRDPAMSGALQESKQLKGGLRYAEQLHPRPVEPQGCVQDQLSDTCIQ